MTYSNHETAIIDEGAIIGKNTRIWHWTHICSGAEIGEDCTLGQNVFIGNKVIIGNRVKIQNNVSVYDGVILKDNVFCGPSVVFTNVYNPRSSVSRKNAYRNTLVQKGATLGANCTIICGVVIGRHAFVGAGSVVTKDIKDYALMIGSPAIQIGWISEHGERLTFNENGIATCPGNGENYQLKDNKVTKVII